MAAETLLREVEERRKKALEQLDAEHVAKKEEITKRTEEERAYILESAKSQAADLAQRERIRIEGAAKLQAKKMIFDATEKMLESNLASLRQAAMEFAGTKEYAELLPRMLKYASKRLGGAISVRCRQSDVPVMKKAGVDVLSSNLNSIGGFKAEKKDGTIELDLTFEEILRSREEDVRALILSRE